MQQSRRDFVKSSAVAATAAVAGSPIVGLFDRDDQAVVVGDLMNLGIGQRVQRVGDLGCPAGLRMDENAADVHAPTSPIVIAPIGQAVTQAPQRVHCSRSITGRLRPRPSRRKRMASTSQNSSQTRQTVPESDRH